MIRVSSRTTVSGPGASMNRSGPSSSTFSLPSAQEAPKSNTSAAVGALSGLEALLALQEAEGPLERKKRAVKRGRFLLSGLDHLKAALLSGTVHASSVGTIIEGLKDRSSCHDPELNEILEHIELRARVELAKLGIPQ